MLLRTAIRRYAAGVPCCAAARPGAACKHHLSTVQPRPHSSCILTACSVLFSLLSHDITVLPQHWVVLNNAV